MAINSKGICAACGRDYEGDVAPGAECPEKDDCPSHVAEKGKLWWADDKTYHASMAKTGAGRSQV